MRWPRRLSQKLVLTLTVCVVLVAIINGWLATASAESQLRASLLRSANQLSGAITSATWHAMLADNRETAYLVMQTIAAKQGIRSIRIFNKEGRVMFAAPPTERRQVDKNAEACFLCHASEKPLVKVDVATRARVLSDRDGTRTLAMITPIYNEPACSNASCHAHPAAQNVLGVLDIALDMSPVDEQVRRIEVRTLVGTVVSVLLVGVLATLFVQRMVARPLEGLAEATRAVAEMRLDEPIAITSSEELSRLSQAFNVMRERLAEAVAEINGFARRLEAKVAERTEQLRIAQQKLLQADRLASLGQLSASVAHEINNPLSGVLNLSMLLQRIVTADGIPKGREAEFRKYLDQVVKETARTGRIVSDLLAFSRRSKPHRALVDLNGVVRTTLAVVAHKLKLMDVTVVTDLPHDLPPVKADGSQLQQVVMNLVLNGAEATRRKGSGHVWVRTLSAPGGDAVVLEVKDDGEGIPPELVAKIFDPFFTTKEDGKGVGLGLAVVYGIVQAHGGDVEVASVPGRETVFRVTLPRDGEEPAAGGEPPAGRTA